MREDWALVVVEQSYIEGGRYACTVPSRELGTSPL
jgi:hypothetical protein